jgi:hypothetical protein
MRSNAKARRWMRDRNNDAVQREKGLERAETKRHEQAILSPFAL